MKMDDDGHVVPGKLCKQAPLNTSFEKDDSSMLPCIKKQVLF